MYTIRVSCDACGKKRAMNIKLKLKQFFCKHYSWGLAFVTLPGKPTQCNVVCHDCHKFLIENISEDDYAAYKHQIRDFNKNRMSRLKSIL